MIKPQQYAIYKGITGKNGAIQYNLQLPHFYRGKEKDFTGERALDSTGKLNADWKQREGAMFVEITSATGPNQYDWEHKITMALSITDMGKLLAFFHGQPGAELKIMHDPGAATEAKGAVKKFLNFVSPNGILGGGCIVNCTMTSAGQNVSHKVPMSTDECLVLKRLVETAIPVALAWNQ